MSTEIEQFKKFVQTENVTQHIKRFYEHMPHPDDIIISILKGHLLVEEQLFELISVEAEKPQALKDSRLTFHQTLCIAESLFWHEDSEWVWSSCRKLNSLRNSLSHELEPSHLDKNIKEFLRFVEKKYPPDGKKQVHKNQSTRLLTSIALVYAYLSAYLQACKNTKRMKKE